MHKMSLAHANPTVDEQRVVAAGRAARHGSRGRVSKLVAGSHHEVLKVKLRIQLARRGSEDRFRRRSLNAGSLGFCPCVTCAAAAIGRDNVAARTKRFCARISLASPQSTMNFPPPMMPHAVLRFKLPAIPQALAEKRDSRTASDRSLSNDRLSASNRASP